MSFNQHYHHHRKSPFEISEMAAFDDSIEDDTEDEKLRKRRAYLQQAIDQANAGKGLFKAFGCMLIPFIIIPLFWPILFIALFGQKKMAGMIDGQIASACQYWGFSAGEFGYGNNDNNAYRH